MKKHIENLKKFQNSLDANDDILCDAISDIITDMQRENDEPKIILEWKIEDIMKVAKEEEISLTYSELCEIIEILNHAEADQFGWETIRFQILEYDRERKVKEEKLLERKDLSYILNLVKEYESIQYTKDKELHYIIKCLEDLKEKQNNSLWHEVGITSKRFRGTKSIFKHEALDSCIKFMFDFIKDKNDDVTSIFIDSWSTVSSDNFEEEPMPIEVITQITFENEYPILNKETQRIILDAIGVINQISNIEELADISIIKFDDLDNNCFDDLLCELNGIIERE